MILARRVRDTDVRCVECHGRRVAVTWDGKLCRTCLTVWLNKQTPTEGRTHHGWNTYVEMRGRKSRPTVAMGGCPREMEWPNPE